jgi:hypothetical protein
VSKAVRPAGQTYDAMCLPIAEDGVRKWGPAEKMGVPCDDGQAWTLRRDLEQRFAGGIARQAAVADELAFDGHRMAGQCEVHLLLDYGVEGRWVNEDDEPSLNRSSCSTPIKWPATTRSSHVAHGP